MSLLADRLRELGIEIEPQLMDLAFTHRSWAYENGRGATNERLEFLGDAVLGAVVTEHIFREYADRSEGQLAKLRAAVVSGHTLAQVARGLQISSDIKLGRGEVATHGEDKDSILADVMEAVIGAVHMTGGFPAASAFIHQVMDPVIRSAARLGAGLDWKSSLQETASALGLDAPEYICTASGPDHERVFVAEVVIDGRAMGRGEASSRRGAEQRAAELAYETLHQSSVE